MSISILVVDDEENARKYFADYLTPRGYEVALAPTMSAARKHLQDNEADVMLLDVQLPDGNGLELLEEVVSLPNRPMVILITAHATVEMAVRAMKNRAHDFFRKPISLEEVERSIQKAVENISMRRELNHFRAQQHKDLNFIIGKYKAMHELYKKAQRAALASVSVLISGENGTGKDIVARAIHKMGPRANKPFIDINCPAIQPTMLESELFGYEKGAFTGADSRKLGLMEVADGGILFLDEISSMPVDMQAKLLRALQEQSFRRVGNTSNNPIKVDVQIIAASNRNLPELIRKGEFREDLYYRLKVVDLDLPPLRQRPQDIPEFVGFFIQKHNQRFGKNFLNVTERAMDALMNYEWPGNIRQLEHAIEHAMLFSDDDVLDLPHLPRDIRSSVN